MMDEYDYYDDDEDEVADLWNGRLPMDRVLQTLQSEIEKRQQTQAQLAAAVARAEAAEAEVAALRAQLAEREWRAVGEDEPQPPPGDVPPPIDRTHLRRDPARGG